MPVPLPKTYAAIDKYFENRPDLCRSIKEKAVSVHRGDYGPEADLSVARSDPGLDDTDRVKISMINDIFREETSEGAITNWEFYRDESKAIGHPYPRRDSTSG